MKKIIFLIVVCILIFIIYILNVDKKILYLTLGNNLDVNINMEVKKILEENNKYEDSILEFSNINYKTTDLIKDILNNKIIIKDNKNISLNNSLVKSELIVLNIGYYDYKDYLNNNLFNNIDIIKNDMDTLLKEIRKITKEKVVLIGVKNDSINDKYLEIINNVYKKVCKDNNIYYLNIFDNLSISRELKKYIENDII